MTRAVDIIRAKRDGRTLSRREIDLMVGGISQKDVADYQWSALLMAIVWRGMNGEETAALTDAMMRSGIVVDLSSVPGLKIDKHSTGGVGDKTSLILAPIVAAAGVPVPMVSGRGLGHTGGTLDKLESIPGFRTDLDLIAYVEILRRCGFVMIGQTAEIAPADKFLYAMRDATATVESIPLLSSSIMSKKLAEGIDGLVLDVKTGNGAFMEQEADSRALAETMCEIGRNMGKQVVALLTRMDQPLGKTAGNAIEVVECLECLEGNGADDLMSLSIELAAEMIVMGGKAATMAEARSTCERLIANGEALEAFGRLIEVQGGDRRVIDNRSLFAQPARRIDLPSPTAGYVSRLDARPIGHATMLLGAGRSRMDSPIDHAVGAILHKKLGDRVEQGEPLCTLLVNDERHLDAAIERISNAYAISEERVTPLPLIVDRLDGRNP